MFAAREALAIPVDVYCWGFRASREPFDMKVEVEAGNRIECGGSINSATRVRRAARITSCESRGQRSGASVKIRERQAIAGSRRHMSTTPLPSQYHPRANLEISMQAKLNELAAKSRKAEAEKTVFTVLFAVSFCHFLNDMVQSLITAIYPILKD
jgi:hypothetical protein